MKKTLIILSLAVLFISSAYADERKFASTYISDGLANYEQGNYLEAILNLRSAGQLSPDNPVTVYKYLGMSYANLSLWQQAVKEFCKILYINPDDPERGDIIDKIHDWENEKDHISMMAKYSFYSIKYKNRIWAEPNNLLNYLSLTEIYKCSGRYDEAENFFKALVKGRPDNIDFKKYYAEVLFLDKKYAEAGGLYKQILDDEPLNTDAIIGSNLILKKRYEDILAKRPENVQTYIKLARVYRDMKRYEDAIAAYGAYLEKDSANTEVRREMDETNKILTAVSSNTAF
jgi:tetratricopeptide (TPR) repeat protein